MCVGGFSSSPWLRKVYITQLESTRCEGVIYKCRVCYEQIVLLVGLILEVR